MSRYRLDEARVTVTEHGSRLLVRWASTDHFHDILVGFRAALPRHGDCCWNSEQSAWSVSHQGRSRLEQWLGQTFEPGCVEWLEEEPASQGTGRTYTKGRAYGYGRFRAPAAATTTIEAAYARLCLTPDAPAELVTVVHRWWARQLHPDTGHGDTTKMAAINAAADLIREERERKAS